MKLFVTGASGFIGSHFIERALSDGHDVVGLYRAATFTEAGRDKDFFHRINVLGTANLAAVAAERRVRRFVLCSTGGVYGRRVLGKIDEQSLPRPWNAYESSKLASETVLREIASARGMEHVILRPAPQVDDVKLALTRLQLVCLFRPRCARRLCARKTHHAGGRNEHSNRWLAGPYAHAARNGRKPGRRLARTRVAAQ